jgi:hypothetical protein
MIYPPKTSFYENNSTNYENIQFYENKLQKNNESIQTFLALDRPPWKTLKRSASWSRGQDNGLLWAAYHYAWEDIYQRRLADETGVFEPVCYDGY